MGRGREKRKGEKRWERDGEGRKGREKRRERDEGKGTGGERIGRGGLLRTASLLFPWFSVRL